MNSQNKHLFVCDVTQHADGTDEATSLTPIIAGSTRAGSECSNDKCLRVSIGLIGARDRMVAISGKHAATCGRLLACRGGAAWRQTVCDRLSRGSMEEPQKLETHLGRIVSQREVQLSLQMGCVEPNPGPNGKKGSKNQPNKRRGRQGKMGLASTSAGTKYSIPRQLGFPDSLRTKLRYVIPLQQVLGGGTTNCLRMTSNAYDVDSALASTAMPYFAELAIVYSRFRTLAMAYSFKVSNSETFPQGIIYGVMTNSVSATALGQNYAGNKYMKTTILSPVNGSTSSRTMSGRVTIEELFGTKQALYDDLFTGSTTSSTLSSTSTANCYIGSVSAAIPVNGWFVTGTIELDVVFTRRNSLLT